jgi:dipeptidyl aminopeptidase/acylaminoacyl peptidase
MNCKTPLFLLFLFSLGISYAQQSALPAYQPTRAEMMARYKKAQLLDSITRNTVVKSNVQANWLPGGKSFWYVNTLVDSVREYMYVDVVKARKKIAFDHDRLARSLGKASGETVDPQKIYLGRILFNKDAQQISFEYKRKAYLCDLITYQCNKIDSLPRDTIRYPALTTFPPRWISYHTDSLSPDKKWTAFVKDGNVYIKEIGSEDATQLTTDGSTDKPYDELAWSPDSKYVIGYHTNPVKDSSIYYVLSSNYSTSRGQLRSYSYKQPGDPFTTYDMFLFDVDTRKATKVNTEILDFFEAPVLHWKKDNRSFLYEKVDRGHQRFRIIEVDVATGNSRTVVDDKTNTFIYEQRINTCYLPNTNEILLTSEKDGWQHIFLVDATTGKDKNTVTNGNYVVRGIDSIDVKKREIWFKASGMNAGEDPYFVHYYRIGFDGKKLITLTKPGFHHNVIYSSNKDYYLDTYSRVDVPPVTELHRVSDGKLILEVERADISAWQKTGIPLVEPFTAKGRDGVTDIWGVIIRPVDFDPNKRYPVIENIYAGPQDAFVPKAFLPYGEMHSMAQLGFIVVQIDGMGTANRSKAFHDVCWKNLGDAGLPDRILWMKALAKKYPYVDIDRVGVYGTSAGGQNSTGALLFHPEFYKAAVSACGCHDNRIDKQWWNEQWMGYPIGQHYADQSNIVNAAKLKGSLMLIVGEADNNVPPESTYRLADALIKAGKTFDFLDVPGMGHGDGGTYGRAKKRDFFVKHLLGVDPPDRNNGELLSRQ